MSAGRFPVAAGFLDAGAFLNGGTLPIHGVAFAVHGHATVVTGPSGAGKTGVLLAALVQGAQLIAAEHAHVAESGALHGQPEAVRVRPRHRGDLPASVHRRYRIQLAAWAPVDRLSVRLARLPGVARPFASRLRERIRDRAFVDVPAEGFTAAALPAAFETLVILDRADEVSRVSLEPMSDEAAARRLTVLFAMELEAGPSAAVQTQRADATAKYERLARAVLLGHRLLLATIPPGELSRADARQIAQEAVTRRST